MKLLETLHQIDIPDGISAADLAVTRISKSRMKNNIDLLRAVEKQLLDQQHLNYALLGRSEGVAITSVLLRFAQVIRDLRTGKIAMPNNNTKSEVASKGLRGLGRCLRWILESSPTSTSDRAADQEVLANEALQLLQWGVKYDALFSQHSAMTRDLTKFEIDEEGKTITFLPPEHINPRFFCSQTDAKKMNDERLAQEYPEEHLAKLSKQWFDSVTWSGGDFHLDDSKVNSAGAIDVANDWLTRTCIPELPPETVLIGCTIAEIRRVLASMYVYALFGTRLEDVVDEQQRRRKLASRLTQKTSSIELRLHKW